MNIKQKAPKLHDFEADAAEALAAAREMPPGRERIEALKQAGRLRRAADTYAVIFANPVRSSN